MSRIVLALGGNALGNTPEEQKRLVSTTAKVLVDLIEEGHEVIITHGNGPQVGMIHLAFQEAMKQNDRIPSMPLTECGAMSQGYIGYHLQNAMQTEMLHRNILKPIATIVTQVVVDAGDDAFQNPSKPIGSFYTFEQAQALMKESNHHYIEDAKRGYRRVVASPNPVSIVELPVISELVKLQIPVIACGGGGIPVILENQQIKGVEAVIDKDLASAKLAELLEADVFIILTAVEYVSLYYGKDHQQDLKHLTVKECLSYMVDGHFAKGSMYPKVKAAMSFASTNPNRKAIIASLEKAKEAIHETSGTVVTMHA